ncbi:MAG: anion permease [Nitrospiria bacterium]
MLIVILFVFTLFLAYVNGANDNFKGVATLYGSRTVDYATAIQIATIATFAGSLCALFFAQGLVAGFSGKGLVPKEIVGNTHFLLSVGFGAAGTVWLATRWGFPISTTHSLVGGLLGAGLMAVGLNVNFQRLGGAFFLPLLVSPLIAFTLCAVVYRIFSHLRRVMGLSKESCLCVGEQRQFVPVRSLVRSNTLPSHQTPPIERPGFPEMTLTVADTDDCIDLYTDRVLGLPAQRLLDLAHGASAIMVSFARGLNDTPKIAGLLVAAQAFDLRWGMSAIAAGIALGGWLNARKVAETLSHKITELTHGQGFSANLITGFLVIIASKLGVPVSTTHVSVGSIMGIGMMRGERNTGMIVRILLSWLITLPVAVGLSAFMYFMLS